MAVQDDITALLHRFRQGDDGAKAALIAAVYDDLKVMEGRPRERVSTGAHERQRETHWWIRLQQHNVERQPNARSRSVARPILLDELQRLLSRRFCSTPAHVR